MFCNWLIITFTLCCVYYVRSDDIELAEMGKKNDEVEMKEKAATGQGDVGTEDAGIRRPRLSGVDEPDETMV